MTSCWPTDVVTRLFSEISIGNLGNRRSVAHVRIDGVKALEAQYENGVLRLSDKLALRPGERVSIIVIRRMDQSRWDLARLARKSDEETTLTEQGLVEWTRALDAEDQI